MGHATTAGGVKEPPRDLLSMDVEHRLRQGADLGACGQKIELD